MKIQKRSTQRFDLVLQLTLVIVAVLALAGCATPTAPRDLTPEPSQADKAMHNCLQVLTATPIPFTDPSLTPEIVCENQRGAWSPADFEEEWIVEIDRLIDFYDADPADLSLYRS